MSTLTPQHSLSQLPGIGRHTPRALALYGIKTIGQFARFTYEEVDSFLGYSGRRLLKLAKTIN